jgi:hypothetical protein
MFGGISDLIRNDVIIRDNHFDYMFFELNVTYDEKWYYVIINFMKKFLIG